MEPQRDNTNECLEHSGLPVHWQRALPVPVVGSRCSHAGARVTVRMTVASQSATRSAASVSLPLAVTRASHSGAGRTTGIGAIIGINVHRHPTPPRSVNVSAAAFLRARALLALATLVLILCNVSTGNAQCPDNTWTLYVDTFGVEGNVNSCIKLFNTNTASWQASSSACVALGGGAHLLTSRQVCVCLCVLMNLLVVL